MSIYISVIIPIYNAEKYLPRCLDSIINQTYSNLEIILINDGSSDASGNICDSYAKEDSRVKVIHQSNAGVSAARNAGLDIATGDYISFVDPDDWIESNMYEVLVGTIQGKEIDILRFNAYRKGEIINKLPFRGEYSNKELEEKILLPLIGAEKFGGMFILGVLWLHLYKREVIEDNHIRFNPQLRRCEDRLFTLSSVIHAKSILFVDEVLYHYEVYDNSLSNRYDPERWEQELIYLSELKARYHTYKPEKFYDEADKRLLGEYLLRAITSISNEFFSNNRNNFRERYKNTKTIINNPIVRTAIRETPREKSGLKGKLILGAIKYKQPFLLSLLNTAILIKNKI